jgi:hypothetical protein
MELVRNSQLISYFLKDKTANLLIQIHNAEMQIRVLYDDVSIKSHGDEW